MEDTLFIKIKGSRYRLYSHNDVTWQLFCERDRKHLLIFGAHNLDYWRKKGRIAGEKGNKRG